MIFVLMCPETGQTEYTPYTPQCMYYVHTFILSGGQNKSKQISGPDPWFMISLIVNTKQRMLYIHCKLDYAATL